MSGDDHPLSYRYQSALAPLAASAEEPATRKRLSEVLALLDFNSTLNRSFTLAEVLDLALFVSMGETRASWAGILLKRKGDGRLTPVARRGRDDARWGELALEVPDGAPEVTGLTAGDDSSVGWASELLEATDAGLLVPLVSAGKLIGALLLGSRETPFDVEDLSFVEGLGVSAAAAADSRRVHEELQQLSRRLLFKVYQLNSVFDITRELNRSPDVERVRDVLVTHAMGHVLTTRAVLVHDGKVVVQRGLTLTPEDRARIERARGELERLDENTPIAELDDPEVHRLLKRVGIGSLIPLRSGESCHGCLLLGPRASGKPLAGEDLDFLRSLAAQAAAALDNLRLTREWLEKQKIEKEMALARDIQRGLLPESDPAIGGWEISGINIPCLTVGGDYFDYVARDGDKHWLVIADVSGKGTGAALIMASVQAALHALAGVGDIALEALCERLNEIVYESTQMNRYVTAFFATVHADTGAVSYVNAGHCYPILLRANGEVERLVDGGPVIGMFPDLAVQRGTTSLEPGDLLVLYTDGLSETASPDGVEFEDERIIALLEECRGMSSREIMARLVSGVRVFAAEAGLSDDLTLMVVQRTGATDGAASGPGGVGSPSPPKE